MRNVTLEKDVIARVTQNSWESYEDILATYVDSINEDYDEFSIILRRSDKISFALKGMGHLLLTIRQSPLRSHFFR